MTLERWGVGGWHAWLMCLIFMWHVLRWFLVCPTLLGGKNPQKLHVCLIGLMYRRLLSGQMFVTTLAHLENAVNNNKNWLTRPERFTFDTYTSIYPPSKRKLYPPFTCRLHPILTRISQHPLPDTDAAGWDYPAPLFLPALRSKDVAAYRLGMQDEGGRYASQLRCSFLLSGAETDEGEKNKRGGRTPTDVETPAAGWNEEKEREEADSRRRKRSPCCRRACTQWGCFTVVRQKAVDSPKHREYALPHAMQPSLSRSLSPH